MKTILAIGGHDPSGGAGIQADIETITANGAHTVTCITALTVQNTRNVYVLQPVDVDLFSQVLNTLASDFQFDAIKIGLIGDAGLAVAITEFVSGYSNIPVILDPVLAAGGGTELSSAGLQSIMVDKLLPHISIITPNLPEAQRLSGKSKAEDCAQVLIEKGAGSVFISGGHSSGAQVINRYFDADGSVEKFAWDRLDGEFHGSGCTLASAIAVFLAKELPVKLALRLAQAFTHDALKKARMIGKGQKIPQRVGGVG